MVLLSSLLVCAPTVVGANAFVGGKAPQSYIQGAKADIKTPDNYPSIASPDWTSAWVLLKNNSTGNLAQTGFLFDEYKNAYPRYFVGYIQNGYYGESFGTWGPAKGSTHTYTIKKVNGKWAGYVDSTLIESQPYEVSPTQVEFFNENDVSSVSYLGKSTDKLKFSNVYYWDGSASTSDTSKWVWRKPNMIFPSPHTNSAIDTSNWSSGGYWYSWDTRN